MIEEKDTARIEETSPYKSLEEVEAAIKQAQIAALTPKNRAERRALRKKLGKKGRNNVDAITNTAIKLNQIDLIQKLRKLNEKENGNNEGSN